MRRAITIAGILILVVVLFLSWSSQQQTRYGFTLTRFDDKTIRISWGTPSGVNISPKSTMAFFLGHSLEFELKGKLPILSRQNDVWMYDVDPQSLGSATPASYVNPLNDGAINQMFEMISGRTDGVTMTRMAARHYTYLGWAVMNDDDVQSLKSALTDRSQIALDQDLQTSGGMLYRLEQGIETHFAENPNDTDELAAIRRTIPVMFEVLDAKAGHPCEAMHVLFLDGHVERILVGDKFPATETFIKSFPPPRVL